VFFNINGAEYVRAESVELNEASAYDDQRTHMKVYAEQEKKLRETFAPKPTCRLSGYEGSPLCEFEHGPSDCEDAGRCLA
jgi:hypothetical protein